MIDKGTGEKINLKVPGSTVDEATHKVTAMGCFGAKGPYKWGGSGPLYDIKGKRLIMEQ